MVHRIFTVLLLSAVLFSCEQKEEKQTEITREEVDMAARTLEQKQASGDTLVVPAEELLKILPEKVEGFVPDGEAELLDEKAAGSSWSVAARRYRKGNIQLRLTVADYNGAYGMYAGATSVFSEMDNEEERTKVISLKDGKVKGWESFRKQSHESSLMLAVSNRYLITLEADHQQDTSFLLSLVDKINLEKLPGY